jgi:hypothetical protein
MIESKSSSMHKFEIESKSVDIEDGIVKRFKIFGGQEGRHPDLINVIVYM